ncbi:hypothetical protein Poli38472_002502 [Pythium oligandrum]|uniref:Uncharacterized protein n=1 Tax=Pythium oligandrum TaxID=41045 RepID=A0A8K1CHB8_PYTOL|nr:hypothetical protein Poli38472_002502 [Pythium oligandrum]|eukprot:TMW63561.1 hypothetical protein Poli38472_002502 [Pythium oligandrum]
MSATTSSEPVDGAENVKNTSLIFHVSLGYNLFLHHEKRRPWWSRVQTHLLLGALPLREKRHLEVLTKEENVQAVVTMNQPTELQPNWLNTPVSPDDWAAANVVQCFGTTEDFSPPSLETIQRCVAFVHEQTSAGKTTYVHCKAGRGRSTVVVIAYLMQHHGMTLDQAHVFVRGKRRHISLHPKQRRILENFATTL